MEEGVWSSKLKVVRAMEKSPMQQLLAELEAEGIVKKTGEMFTNPKTGELAPLYVLVPRFAAVYGEGGEGLLKYIREHYEFTTTH